MIITLSDVFPVRKSYTDIVSAATDNFAAVDSKVFASLPADVQCGDVIDALALSIPRECGFRRRQ
jgi:hypothetical protein